MPSGHCKYESAGSQLIVNEGPEWKCFRTQLIVNKGSEWKCFRTQLIVNEFFPHTKWKKSNNKVPNLHIRWINRIPNQYVRWNWLQHRLCSSCALWHWKLWHGGTGNPGSATSLDLALALLNTKNIAQRHSLEIFANINPRLGQRYIFIVGTPLRFLAIWSIT